MLNVADNIVEIAPRDWSSAGALWPQNLLELSPNFAVLNKLPAIRSCQPKVYRLNEMAVVLQVAA